MAYKTALYYDATLYGLSDIEQSIQSLLKCAHYLGESEKQQLISCCFFAARAHEGQKRRSGEPYICHPIKVAEILAQAVRFDLPVLQGAILHDVIEDTHILKSQLIDVFSEEVADLVDGVSKLEKEKNISPQEMQAKTFTKLVIAMEADPRVVMIKFADRMHNMHTLDALRPDKRHRIAQETLDVYVPIASRLGMFMFKTELQELAFKHLYPWRFAIIDKIARETHPERESTYVDVKETLLDKCHENGMKVSIRKRRRNLYEIYKKLERLRFNRRPLERSSIPIIIITDERDACYRVLGIIHELYTPIEKKLSDYIASPKANGYQSIHTSVLTDDRRVINFQIRSKEMHAVAESGIIAIWREHNQAKNNGRLLPRRREKTMRRWLGNIKSLSTIAESPIEFYESVKRDLIDFDIQVLTPKGEPIALPEGASVIDFAYCVHTELGNHLSRAEVNGVEVPLDYQLTHGQTVELFAHASAMPETAWLKYVKTGRARTSIRNFLRDLSDDVLQELGFQEIKNHLERHNISYRYLRKMLTVIAENRQISTAALLKRIALHEVKRKTIRTELQALAYQEGVSSKITLKLLNRPGILSAVTDIIGRREANIIHMDFPEDMQAEMVVFAFVIHLELQSHVQEIVSELQSHPLVKHVKYEEHIE